MKDNFDLIAEIIEEEIAADVKRAEENLVFVPPELHEKMIAFANELDRDDAAKKRRTFRRKAARFAAIFTACFITMGSFAVSTSEAFRLQILHLFYNNETDSVTLRNETEYDYIGSWDEYWYPEWLPEGFYMLGAVEKDHLMVFVNENSPIEIRFQEYSMNSSASLDIHTSTAEKILINDWNVTLYIDRIHNNMTAVWLINGNTLEVRVTGSTEKKILIKVIEKMRFVKK